MDLLQAWQLVVLPFIAAALGAWFTAHFSLRRFFREKEWERKTQAYTAIFEALHNMRAWFDEHWDAEISGREIPEEKQAELGKAYREAKAVLQRRLAAETWLLPEEYITRIRTMMRALSKHHESFFEDLDEGSAAMSSAISDLRRMARRDLKLEGNRWRLWQHKPEPDDD
jgi:hypothetical protein